MYAFALAGGMGFRLWPLSWEMHPKQFLKVNGEHSLLQQTLSCIHNIVSPANTLIITNNHHSENIAHQVNQISGKKDR